MALGLLPGCAGQKQVAAPVSHKQQVVDLMKSIETGDPGPLNYISSTQYIQHNLAGADGVDALRALVKALPKETRINTVRAFEDGDFVFLHNDFNLFGPKVGFDILRYENGKIVEHWDNLETTAPGPNASGHTMIDGPTVATEIEKTASNKALVKTYLASVVRGQRDQLAAFFDAAHFVEHDPFAADTQGGMPPGSREGKQIKYEQVRLILGEGSFVLAGTLGSLGDTPASYIDLFRIQNGKIAEHWDTVEIIPPRSEWKNQNGKF